VRQVRAILRSFTSVAQVLVSSYWALSPEPPDSGLFIFSLSRPRGSDKSRYDDRGSLEQVAAFGQGQPVAGAPKLEPTGHSFFECRAVARQFTVQDGPHKRTSPAEAGAVVERALITACADVSLLVRQGRGQEERACQVQGPKDRTHN